METVLCTSTDPAPKLFCFSPYFYEHQNKHCRRRNAELSSSAMFFILNYCFCFPLKIIAFNWHPTLLAVLYPSSDFRSAMRALSERIMNCTGFGSAFHGAPTFCTEASSRDNRCATGTLGLFWPLLTTGGTKTIARFIPRAARTGPICEVLHTADIRHPDFTLRFMQSSNQDGCNRTNQAGKGCKRQMTKSNALDANNKFI